ncbi:glutamine synthetase family protein [Flammeovirga kamogawensis]|uniref:Glutamine synthetase n=1 Tax=Flammeovirga kamogawensis TaxID=373891 RepID=A0ABX8GYS3_9BACT|nr:glutamine synthetase family protein [Flammeovirga kamogawensis]MBB6458959.1 glutamine synthetase [Flammeovirga kamogawensis]QWG08534.1 glutamine synthetase [Flammeovirga kamogawensis]TRX66826.1 glutamine synthetase [Flammeovirga kamogawensis]
MTKQEIIDLLEDSRHTKVKVAIVDIDGVLRGKYMHINKFISSLDSGFGFCDVVFGWDMADESYDNVKVTGWHTGYPDAPARIDVNTFRQVPWEDDVPFFLADFSRENKDEETVGPRALLKRINTKANDLGFAPLFSQEFEWFNFKQTTTELHEKDFNNIKPLTEGMFGYSILRASENSDFFHALFDMMEDFKVPLEGLHTETGPGVYEAAIQYSDIVEAADRATLFKSSAKEIGYKHGIIASFMAKQNMKLPGCSGHVHQSLWNIDKTQNLFYDADKEDNISDIMQSYIAGQLHCLPFMLPMLAPTINSYKRLVEGAWAPTTLTWAVDNRTTALRALPHGKKSARLETRVVGSDVNPYLAMSACLAAGLYGIENKLKLDTPKTIGNGYEDFKNGTLPSNLWDATQKMKNSSLMKDLFGEEFVEHFTLSREWEWKQFMNHVTDWETKRYFEII